jgi:hypothetical protein
VVKVTSEVRRVALRVPEEAAAALGVSAEAFNEHVRPHVRVVRLGRLVLVTVAELERFGEERSESIAAVVR